MRVAHLNFSDIIGGAARAAWRIHHSLRQANVQSTMYVNSATAGDWTVVEQGGPLARHMDGARRQVARFTLQFLRTGNRVMRSPAVLPSFWVKRINAMDVDIVNLHWICGEMMSIEDIGCIKKPIVWTLMDMWPFCGAEHYTTDCRWRDGYSRRNRPTYESGIDLDRWVWNRKLTHWKRPMHIIAPCRWLKNCVQDSVLMKAWPVSVVPYALDTEFWQPIDRVVARKLMRLPPVGPLLAFGAIGGGNDPRKGMDLLQIALKKLVSRISGLEVIIFGQRRPQAPVDCGFPTHYTGHLNDDLSLRVLYSAADVMVVPSRLEAFGQTASEALACGTPVVAFGACGPLDIVKHQETGYLAKPYDALDLAEGISWVLSRTAADETLQQSSRRDAVARFSYPVVAGQYLQVYNKVIDESATLR